MIDRRQLLGALAAPLLTGDSNARAQTIGLGAIAEQAGLLFGSAFDREILTDADDRRLIAREAHIVTTENSLKFDWLRPNGPKADFTIADQLVDFAARNRLKLRGTALIWNDNPPPWLYRLSSIEMRKIFDQHIEETLSRYSGRIHSWDIVNEPFYPPQGLTGGYRKGPWYTAFGDTYIDRAFRRAAAADPKTRLTLNEAFCEQDDALGRSVRANLLALVERLKTDGVPLHAIGLQGHLKPALPFDDHAFVEFLSKLASFGVDLFITELDIDDSAMPDDVAERDRLIARRYRDFLTSVLTVPAVKAVITWQLSDRYSWYADLAARKAPAGRAPRPLPFDRDFKAKAAADAIALAFAGRKA